MGPTHAGWVPTTESFGARLALTRQALRLNTKQAAEKCDIWPETWRRWERGHSPREMDVIAHRVADGLGVDYVWLLSGVTADGSASV